MEFHTSTNVTSSGTLAWPVTTGSSAYVLPMTTFGPPVPPPLPPPSALEWLDGEIERTCAIARGSAP